MMLHNNNVIRSVIRGVGGYLPKKVLTNDDLAKFVDTSDAWIYERSGIKQRHLADDNELTSDLAIAAARQALERAKLNPIDIDLVIVATTTPDNTLPATACTVQAKLGMVQGVAFDIQAVCSGFVFALATADNFLRCGTYQRALVIGAETITKLLDWEDRSTCVLFGDGAGAVVLEAQPGDGTVADRGVLSSHLRSDGRYKNKLYADGGPSSTGTVGSLRMEGKEVFKHAVINIAEVIQQALHETGFKSEDIDWFVPHQANKRILDSTAHRIGLDPEKVILTVEKHANTSAASIPLALNDLYESGRLEKGHLVLFEAMGGGFTWGSTLARW
jgi:3-oxoacyl-[acyl-carrier-protein] synthase-3